MLADRVRRRPLLVATNLATAALVLLLLLVRDRHQGLADLLVMFGYGVSGSLLGPAQTALVQAIVPADLLGDANGVLQTAQQGMRLVTPLAGAGLRAWQLAGRPGQAPWQAVTWQPGILKAP
jgi:MFS family permease